MLIEFRQCSKLYGSGDATVRAIDAVTLSIAAGEFVAIMGPSGSGKSTTMHILGCLDTPSAGAYLFKQVDAGRLDQNRRALLRRHYIGFIFQGFNLLPRSSALENVELPLIYRGMAGPERRRRALLALDRVGLADRARHTPAQLSGGQQQRVAIARAIVSDPLLLLADEPTGNLDSRTSRDIMSLLTRLNRDNGITVVMVTHDPDVAANAARVISFRDGRVVTDERNGDAG